MVLAIPLLLLGTPAAGPSLAVFPLEAQGGVQDGVARVLTEQLVEQTRRTKAFSRVVSTREVEAMLGFERQKQLLDCDTAGCMAELAGALGVNTVMMGTLGRLGGVVVFGVKLVSTGTAAVLSSASVEVCADNDERLLRAVPSLVQYLVTQAALVPGRAVPPQASACGTPVRVAETPAHASNAPWSAILGGVLAGGGVLGVLTALVVGGVAVASYAVPRLVFVDVGAWVPRDMLPVFFNSITGVVAGAGVVLGVVSLVVVAAGGALAASGLAAKGE